MTSARESARAERDNVPGARQGVLLGALAALHFCIPQDQCVRSQTTQRGLRVRGYVASARGPRAAPLLPREDSIIVALPGLGRRRKP